MCVLNSFCLQHAIRFVKVMSMEGMFHPVMLYFVLHTWAIKYGENLKKARSMLVKGEVKLSPNAIVSTKNYDLL